MSRHLLVNGLLVAVLVGLLLLGGWWQRTYRLESDASLPLDPTCDLRAGPCMGRIPDGGSLVFAIKPRDIPLLKPLELQVHLDGVQADNVAVEITGVNMDMGHNRVELAPQADGGYLGQAVLPICSQRKMIWQALVLVEGDRGRIAAPFHFSTARQ